MRSLTGAQVRAVGFLQRISRARAASVEGRRVGAEPGALLVSATASPGALGPRAPRRPPSVHCGEKERILKWPLAQAHANN
ncbi:hypothetical protein CDAR_416261 [Caerostris darwini]|uniref:Uncharacterized protein n=1 Tax=Caerostris darwini TaxID=1538125 RepID=A0AAV4W750_9ARAC|nr:hypothetical protein CDAR_416261 [Caerostris darwini]